MWPRQHKSKLFKQSTLWTGSWETWRESAAGTTPFFTRNSSFARPKQIHSEQSQNSLSAYQILETWDSAREKNCTAAEKGRTRNRFVDILPNDDTRVILRGPDDYINASLIDGYNNAGQFIATQGPVGPEETTDGRKESTVDDFWRMIWEKNVQCVLMLTDCVENMRQRCTQYWPPLGETRKFGEVEVDLISESVDPVCTHRELDITRDGERRQLSQYHFLNWRDAKGPECTGHLLDFVERVMDKKFRKPIVVHCR
ncbi:Protein-tyrosine phosphatase [Ancylostoma duodenale]|uniref:Protein-tyrosine phosphatase n=1 Tax=Ancylostoma duodenale TaxID=51022 RepID=A0A0C2DAV4_9BILA|nr:Protein-tyrosine phosphatase [Ancylostoma duodenale]